MDFCIKKGVHLQLTVFFENVFDNPRILSRNARILIALTGVLMCKHSCFVKSSRDISGIAEQILTRCHTSSKPTRHQ